MSEEELRNWQIRLLIACLTVVNGNASRPFAISHLTHDDEELQHNGYSAYWRASSWAVGIEVEEEVLVLSCSQLTDTPDATVGKKFYVFGVSEGDVITPWENLYTTLQEVKQWFHYAVSQLETFKYGSKEYLDNLTKHLR